MKGILGKYLLLELVALIMGLGYFGLKNFHAPESSSGTQTAKPSFEPNQDGFKSIFDGKTLEGWEGDPTYWSVKDGVIVGEITPETKLEANTFLIYQEVLRDFELKAEFRISENGNSGIQYRSERVEGVPFALRGYQADIDGKNTYTGQNYEERKRTTLAYRGQKTRINSQPDGMSIDDYEERNAWKGLNLESELGDRDELGTKIKKQDWNEMHLIIKGNVLKHYVNGILMSEVHDEDAKNRMMSGLLGMQVHVGPPMKVEYRNLMLKKM
ncbi:DUF1080 domain-containing protein [Algoriphagus namhaensis]|uniref:DUF1080 domain-containing protein n=1 Tax=Algoriphagus namhaensis TaxID=915353 RepID=A0ABV8ASP9_9BACT